MIKKIFFGMALLASMVACTDDYTDWSDPQHNDQPATVQFGNGSVTEVPVINIADLFEDKVQVAQITAPTSDDASYSSATYQLKLGGNKYDIALDGKLGVNDLQNYITTNYGKAPEERDIDAVIIQTVSNGSTAVQLTSATFKVKAIPDAADIDTKGYWLVGPALGGWDKDHAVQLTHSETNFWDDPAFTLTFDAVQAGEVAVVKGSDIDSGDLQAVAYGLNNGSLVQGAEFFKADKAGKWLFTMDAEKMTASLALAPTELYMTGDHYGWGNTWLPLVPVNGHETEYWKIIYLHEGEQFKFAPVADWKNDFGYPQASIHDFAGAGIVNEGGNCKATKAGWYLLHVVNDGDMKIIEVLEPNVYLEGDPTEAGWTQVGAIEANKFTVPTTDDGQFVSPELSHDGALRICVILEGIDWWRTEFKLNDDGSIFYRGRGGDYSNYDVKQGQKVYLDFTNNTGEVK